jgi:hypothetical protein
MRGVAVMEAAPKLRPGESRCPDELPVRVGIGQLEEVLCEIHSDGCSIHLGLLLVALTLTPHDASWHDDAERSEGVHPITGTDSQRRSAVPRGTAAALYVDMPDVERNVESSKTTEKISGSMNWKRP